MNTKKYDVLLLDRSNLCSYAIGFLFFHFNFLVSQFFTICECDDILPTLKKHEIDFLFINYPSCRFDLCNEIKKAKRIFPEIRIVVFNFSHSEFEKIHLLKAGVNALLEPECSKENLILMMQEVRHDTVYFNKLVDPMFAKRINKLVIEKISDLTMQEISLIRDCCNGLSHSVMAKKYARSKSRIDNVFHDIHAKTACKTQIDYIRFALIYKIIDWSDKLLTDEEQRKFS